MRKAFVGVLERIIILPIAMLTIQFSTITVFAQNQNHQNSVYDPMMLNGSAEISDKLTAKDIPTGQGGFARDYVIKLNKGDNLAIDLLSDNFDTIITLLAPNGSTVAENDDGPDGTSNSLLFTRITEAGNYIIRVRSFGETGVGNFKLKVTKLIPTK
jgi:hypothetical protein